MSSSSAIKLFLVGDVMLARGIDMIQDFSCDPKLYEGQFGSAKKKKKKRKEGKTRNAW